ncbi:MAG TPA: isoprenylcysteine carboxylmethyltransferase family protein, partial [Chloroflexota bacterium]
MGSPTLIGPESALSNPPTRLWHALVAIFRELEATTWGGLLFGNVWPAYLFALPLGARALTLRRLLPTDGSVHAGAQLLQEVVTIAFLAETVILFAIRRRGIAGQRATLTPALVALLGTFILNVVAYLPVDDATSTASLFASSAVIILGTLFTIWSLATLGRCFGLLPEVRGLVIRGPYSLVRHPVYLGEIVSAIGLLLAKPHPLVVAIFVAFVGLQVGRTVFEERALTAAFPEEYPALVRRVP